MHSNRTMYDRVGGQHFFERVTTAFYRAVVDDPVLSALYPTEPEELELARQHLEWFLIQYWGGPQVYAERRGAPALRMRHIRFEIGEAERDAWIRHMTTAVRDAHLHPLDESQMISYLEMAARHLVNVAPGGPGDPA
jgi:hemoglobin